MPCNMVCRYAGERIYSFSVHPGNVIYTNLMRHSFWLRVVFTASWLFSKSPVCHTRSLYEYKQNTYRGPFVPSTSNTIPIPILNPKSRSLCVQQQAAASVVYCAASAGVESLSGRYVTNVRPFVPARNALSTQTARTLWQLSNQLCTRFEHVAAGFSAIPLAPTRPANESIDNSRS